MGLYAAPAKYGVFSSPRRAAFGIILIIWLPATISGVYSGTTAKRGMPFRFNNLCWNCFCHCPEGEKLDWSNVFHCAYVSELFLISI